MSSAGTAREMPSELRLLLERRPSTHIRWGLERIDAILAALDRPERAFRSVHIGGTNGKGSVAATAAAVLRRQGHRVGLYTSPHLIDFRERIRVGGAPADDRLLEECAALVRPLAERADATFFEASTALAFEAFARSGVEIAVVEVGLGGRLDATNVLRPEVSVVTNVSYDHADYLGNTLQEIAGEKAGILKASVPAVVGPMPQRLLRTFEGRSRDLASRLSVLGRDAVVESIRVALDGTRFVYRSGAHAEALSVHTPLIGAHQALNAATALLALEQLTDSPGPEEARQGVEAASWPGRFQVLARRDGTWILDLAHNTAAAAALAETLRQVPMQRPLVFLLAILGDKPWPEMLDPLLSAGSGAVFTLAPSSPPARRWDPDSARRTVQGHRVEVEPDFDRALSRARELAGVGTVVVTGSCHTVGDALLRLGTEGAEAG